MNEVISVSKLGKSIFQYRSEWRRFASWFGLSPKPSHLYRILQDLTFSVHAGETVGIIGKNGAGKSTLLKLITGTMLPTSGTITVRGTIGAILELGMGLNPEFTGRQNVYYSAGLLGLSPKAINKVLPEIEEFTEIGPYFDEPMRTYSSGMHVRLAFAIATAIQPDILIVDEALSVGDAYFQVKCFQRIRSFQKKGTTLLIVSHDPSTIQALCNRAILLDKGRLIEEGDPHTVMDHYNALLSENRENRIRIIDRPQGKKQICSGSGEARFEEISLLNESSQPAEWFNVGEKTELRIRVKVHAFIPRLIMGYAIKNALGQFMYGTNTHHTNQPLEDLMPGQSIQFSIRFPMNLGPGNYSITLTLTDTDTHLSKNFEWQDLALVFSVVNNNKPIFVGNAWVPSNIRVEND